MPRTTAEVLANHSAPFDAGDLDGLLADYADDSVLFTVGGPLIGREAMRPVFAKMIAEFALPGSTFTILHEAIHGRAAYILWKAETPWNTYEPGTDTFVIEHGQIVVQSFTARVVASGR